jgi:SIR2-like domain
MPNEAKDSASEYQLIGPAEDGKISDLLEGKAAKESRQRLQALIAEWLRMENLVVLTGAGTSVSSGGQTMDKLESAVLETLKQLPTAPPSMKAVIDQRLAAVFAKSTSSAPLGFEDWLSYLVNGHFITSMPNSPFTGVQWKSGASPPTQDDLSWFVKWVRLSIFAECALALSRNASAATKGPSEVAPHLAFLAKLVARDSNLGRAHLFTLNYDTLFEQACELLGIQYFDGFTGRADARFDPSVYGLDIYYPGEVSEGRVRRFDKFLHFYKLHGSIHWQLRDDEVRARHPNLSLFNSYHQLDSAEKAKALNEKAETLPSVGILPTANKFRQTLAMPFAHLFRSFQSRLSAPQTFLLVLGYGFGDEHVTRIVESALMNPSLVMLVVEPNPACPTIARIRQYKDLGKRAFVLTATESAHAANPFRVATFDDFSRSIMPDVQWLDDFLRLRRFEKQIQASVGQVIEDAGSDAR